LEKRKAEQDLLGVGGGCRYQWKGEGKAEMAWQVKYCPNTPNTYM
jgi:hypothetical protein